MKAQTEFDNLFEIVYSQHNFEKSCYDSDDDEIGNNNDDIKMNLAATFDKQNCRR